MVTYKAPKTQVPLFKCFPVLIFPSPYIKYHIEISRKCSFLFVTSYMYVTVISVDEILLMHNIIAET